MTAPRLRHRFLRALVPLALVAGVVSEGRWIGGAAREALPLIPLEPLAAQGRVLGSDYVEAIERAREAIPVDGEYLLLDGSPDGSAAHGPRYDLAPRRARLVGVERGGLWLVDVSRVPGGRRLPVLLCQSDAAPELLSAEEAVGRLSIAQLTRQDDSIPAGLDVPAEGDVAPSGTVVVQGWCQERGGRPCAQVHVFVGETRVADAEVLRFPRPDVEAAIEGIGSCSRAGFQLPVTLPPDGARHEVKVLLIAADGRYRWLGPHTVTRVARR